MYTSIGTLRPLNLLEDSCSGNINNFNLNSLGFSFITNGNSEGVSILNENSEENISKCFKNFTKNEPRQSVISNKSLQEKHDYIYCFLIELNYCNYFILQTRQPENSKEIQSALEKQLGEVFDSMDFFVKQIKLLCILNSSLEPLIKNIPDKFFEKDKENIIKLIDNIVFFNNSCAHLLNIFKNLESGAKIINKNYIVYYKETNVCKIFKDQSIDLEAILKPIVSFYVIPCDNLMESSVSSNVLDVLHNKTFSNQETLIKLYESLVELQKTINEKISEIKSNEPIDNEETRIKTWLTSNYELSDNIEYKIKAANLSEILEGVLSIDVSSKMAFRNRLSKYLGNLGLNKKRFGDGFYYYGLKKIGSKNSNLLTKMSIEDLMKQREASIVDILESK
jgi:hypothetical protein